VTAADILDNQHGENRGFLHQPGNCATNPIEQNSFGKDDDSSVLPAQIAQSDVFFGS